MKNQDIIDAIEFNWNCLLTTRAIFSNNDFGTSMKYNSPSFYCARDIDLSIQWRKLGEFQSKYKPKDLNYWHNANFIIRLYGVLDEGQLLKPEFRECHDSLKLIYLLRNKVGAHQNGLKKPKVKYLKQANELFQKLGIEGMEVESITNFNLAIDGVILKLKNALIEDIKKLNDSR
jgi:hypothetical protein